MHKFASDVIYHLYAQIIPKRTQYGELIQRGSVEDAMEEIGDLDISNTAQVRAPIHMFLDVFCRLTSQVFSNLSLEAQ